MLPINIQQVKIGERWRLVVFASTVMVYVDALFRDQKWWHEVRTVGIEREQ